MFFGSLYKPSRWPFRLSQCKYEFAFLVLRIMCHRGHLDLIDDLMGYGAKKVGNHCCR